MRKSTALAGLLLLVLATACSARDVGAGGGFNFYGGALSGSSDLTHGINPNLALSTSGWLYNVEMYLNGYADDRFKVIPSMFSFLFSWEAVWSDPKDLKLSDGSLFPAEPEKNPFQYSDFSVEMAFIPATIPLLGGKNLDLLLSPKIGICSHYIDHDFLLYLTRFNGKTGTVGTYGDDIYYGTIRPDLYGVVLGAYLLAAKIVRIDLDLSYLPLGPLLFGTGSSWLDHFTSIDGDTDNASVDSSSLLKVKLNASIYLLYPLHFDLRLSWNSFTANGYKPVSFFGGSYTITDKPAINVSDLMIIFGLGFTL
jgi:hypothetical protein